MCVRARACVCARVYAFDVCMCVCVRVYVYVCVRTCVCMCYAVSTENTQTILKLNTILYYIFFIFTPISEIEFELRGLLTHYTRKAI